MVGSWTGALYDRVMSDYKSLKRKNLHGYNIPELHLLPHEYSNTAHFVPYEDPAVVRRQEREKHKREVAAKAAASRIVTVKSLKPAASDNEMDKQQEEGLRSVIVEESGISDRCQRPIRLSLDGPFSAPASDVFAAEHAVLVSTGFGVTPMATILHTVLYRYRLRAASRLCRDCREACADDLRGQLGRLQRVDFVWIVRNPSDVISFEDLLASYQRESEMRQLPEEGDDPVRLEDFLKLHVYVTKGVADTDMCSAALRIALQAS